MARKVKATPALVMNKNTRNAILGLIHEWEGIRDRLRKIADRQAGNREYQDAADNTLTAEAINFCIVDLQKTLAAKPATWTY